MSMNIAHEIYAGLEPWLVLSLLLLGSNPLVSRIRMVVSILLVFFLLRIPLGGWPLFAWIRVLEPNPSFTLTGLLAVALYQRISGRQIFRSREWHAAWTFGSVGALLLYPMGLGITSIDSYAWGWEPFLPLSIALIAALLLLRGNRFGIILLLPLAGFLIDLQESSNFWDALIDPFYAGFSLIVVTVELIKRRRLM